MNGPTTPKPNAINPELAARITAASAIDADFTREVAAYARDLDTAIRPDFQGWAWRLHTELRGLLTTLGATT